MSKLSGKITVGTRIKCINGENYSYLIEGNIYIVRDVRLDNYGELEVYIKRDKCKYSGWWGWYKMDADLEVVYTTKNYPKDEL